MKKKSSIVFITLITTLLLVGTTITATKKLDIKNNQTHKKTIDIPNEEWLNGRRFLWKAPNSPPPEKGYPVLFVLHGGFQHADTWFKQNQYVNRQTKFVNKALEKGFFILAPDSTHPNPYGRKRWDYTTKTINDSTDLPFIQDIIKWLQDSPPVPINNNRLFSIGISSGGLMTSRIAHFFESTFKAVAIHSGGNADFVEIPRIGLPKFDIISPQNISTEHPPTLIIHGNNDRLVPVEAGTHFYNQLQDTGIKSYILLNPIGRHRWQSIFDDKILDWFLYGYKAPSQPRQPTNGPGSSNYSHQDVIENKYKKGAQQFWIFEPDKPKPESAPLIVFNHGWSAIHPLFYRGWINHIVKRGNIVVYPRYQLGLIIGLKYFTYNAINAVKNAIIELQSGDHVHPELDKFAITGHSLGGGITAKMAALAEESNLPIPKAIMPVQPAYIPETNSELSKISNQTFMLVIVGEDDKVVGNQSGKTIFHNTDNIPLNQKDFVIQVTDIYGYPKIIADHFAPACGNENALDSIDTLDYFCTWKLFDALTDYAFYGINKQYCLGNTTEQRYMGMWSDGKPVNEMIITDNP